MKSALSFTLLALASGFLFVSRCNFTKYECARTEGQRLAFLSGVYATFLAILAQIIIVLGQRVSWLESYATHVANFFIPNEIPGLPTFALVFFLALVAPPIINRFIYKEERASKNSIEEFGNEMEKLLNECYASKTLVCVTLNSRKVYVGTSVSMPARRSETTHIRLLPTLSGYRDQRQNIIFTVQYSETISKMQKIMARCKRVFDYEKLIGPLLKRNQALRSHMQQPLRAAEKKARQDFEYAETILNCLEVVIPTTELVAVSPYTTELDSAHLQMEPTPPAPDTTKPLLAETHEDEEPAE